MTIEYTVTPLSEDTFRITETIADNNTYMYLLVGTEKSLLIDTGNGIGDLKQLVAQYTDTPVLVANTHGHLDHIGRNHQFETVMMGDEDLNVYREHASKELRQAFMQPLLDTAGIQLTNEEKQELFDLRVILPQTFPENGIISLGNRKLSVVATPGHTLGSVCFMEDARKQLFTGDTVCDRGVLLNFPHSGSVACFLQSLQTLNALSNDLEYIHPGHHQAPLPVDYIQSYMRLAEAVISGDIVGSSAPAAGEGCLMALMDGIAIAYLANRISD